jgi:hypothetical protein
MQNLENLLPLKIQPALKNSRNNSQKDKSPLNGILAKLTDQTAKGGLSVVEIH